MDSTGRSQRLYRLPPRSAWLDIDWRAHQRTELLDDQLVNLVELGGGQPVVLVHGHAGAWQNWLENIPHLAASRRVVALDLPGFGGSPLPQGGRISVAGYVSVLDRLCARLQLGPATIIGSSMGGLVAAEFAVAHPQRVDRLVLVSPAGLSQRYMRIPRRVLAHSSAPLRVINRASRYSPGRARFMARRVRLRRAGLGGAVRHPELIAPELAAVLMSANGQPGAPGAAAAVARHEMRATLAQINRPTLIVWGAEDAIVAPAAAAQFTRLIHGARSVMLPDTGHVPMLERPAHFNALLDEFLLDGGAS